MVELIKKKKVNPISTRYTFATTQDMKEDLDYLKEELGVDVNEHLRKFSKELIEKAKTKTQAG